ncbi:class I SAM-dependent methyltransferase [Gramella lutea]|uniref:Class I SAM-dependent methyltransferase n=1 Tax=Christiangramia lutea TaxID=1607951 RepID=A0A9X2AB20_9FLAO|nr:class I SAM-dependent methyltransferase [Christiangramia lutea]MCH4823002.1 class I SAM-dependent methyltransferase [Christiangramia lutea]
MKIQTDIPFQFNRNTLKDNFSQGSQFYSEYRPGYPEEVFNFIRSQLSDTGFAWDCGTGNGQVAGKLAEFFHRVEATDISENQLGNAVKKENIHYSIQPAEKTEFNEDLFDLVISAQAVHWFDFESFFAEVKRCMKPDGLLVLLGYGLFQSNPETNKVIHYFYQDIIGPFWDEERRYLEEKYLTIPFPFKELETPEFRHKYNWTIEHLLGYLRTWSAVKHFEKSQKKDPVFMIETDLRKAFGEKNQITFPIFMRLGKIQVF